MTTEQQRIGFDRLVYALEVATYKLQVGNLGPAELAVIDALEVARTLRAEFSTERR